MRTIEDFFNDVEDLLEELDARSSQTIHTDEYESTVRDLYADWQSAKISLKPMIEFDVLDHMDKYFEDLISESRRSKSRVNESARSLRAVEDLYITEVYPQIAGREIGTGFVNSLVSELEALTDD